MCSVCAQWETLTPGIKICLLLFSSGVKYYNSESQFWNLIFQLNGGRHLLHFPLMLLFHLDGNVHAAKCQANLTNA